MSLVTCIPGNIFATVSFLPKLELTCNARKISSHANYLMVGKTVGIRR